MFIRLTYVGAAENVDVSPRHIIRMRSDFSRSGGTLITLEGAIEIHVKEGRDTIYALIRKSQMPDVIIATQTGTA